MVVGETDLQFYVHATTFTREFLIDGVAVFDVSAVEVPIDGLCLFVAFAYRVTNGITAVDVAFVDEADDVFTLCGNTFVLHFGMWFARRYRGGDMEVTLVVLLEHHFTAV